MSSLNIQKLSVHIVPQNRYSSSLAPLKATLQPWAFRILSMFQNTCLATFSHRTGATTLQRNSVSQFSEQADSLTSFVSSRKCRHPVTMNRHACQFLDTTDGLATSKRATNAVWYLKNLGTYSSRRSSSPLPICPQVDSAITTACAQSSSPLCPNLLTPSVQFAPALRAAARPPQPHTISPGRTPTNAMAHTPRVFFSSFESGFVRNTKRRSEEVSTHGIDKQTPVRAIVEGGPVSLGSFFFLLSSFFSHPESCLKIKIFCKNNEMF